jgi:hypothetical protein
MVAHAQYSPIPVKMRERDFCKHFKPPNRSKRGHKRPKTPNVHVNGHKGRTVVTLNA